MYDELIEVLEQISALLNQYRRGDWGHAFASLASRIPDEVVSVQAEIKFFYAGMGSFNDIVLQNADYSLPTEDNDIFDRLRIRLYEIVTRRS